MSDELIISGGPIEGFAGGLAKIPFSGEKVHFWHDVTPNSMPIIGKWGRGYFWESACGRVEAITHDGVKALAPGNWPVCKLCQKRMTQSSDDGMSQ